MLWYFTRGKKRKKKISKFQTDIGKQIFTLLCYSDYVSKRAENWESPFTVLKSGKIKKALVK